MPLPVYTVAPLGGCCNVKRRMYHKNLPCGTRKVWELSLDYSDSQNMNLGQYGACVLLREQKHVQTHQSLTSETISSVSTSKESTSPKVNPKTLPLQSTILLTAICSCGTLITCAFCFSCLPLYLIPSTLPPLNLSPSPPFFLIA